MVGRGAAICTACCSTEGRGVFEGDGEEGVRLLLRSPVQNGQRSHDKMLKSDLLLKEIENPAKKSYFNDYKQGSVNVLITI